MKIGLLTIHDTLNYGSLLQTFSLYKAVEFLNGDITLIDYKCKAIVYRERTLKWKECHTLHDYVRHFFFHKKLQTQYENMWGFMRSNMKITKPYFPETIKETNRLFDTFLVGSDIVWGMNVTGHDFTYMLDFADKDKVKLSFSSSVGTKWDSQDEPRIKSLLSRFNKISVREQLAQNWISNIIGKHIGVTCDPTMLWDKSFWSKYVDHIQRSNYVLVYFTTEDKKNIKDAIQYGKKHNMPVLYINYGKPVWGVKNVRPLTVDEWIGYFAKANAVFSASYHGLLFSLYFHKNVFFYNRGNKSRMISLSEELGIKEREGLDKNLIEDKPIDYSLVDKKLNEKREKSWNVLKEYLNII